jgi:hypothetical protein
MALADCEPCGRVGGLRDEARGWTWRLAAAVPGPYRESGGAVSRALYVRIVKRDSDLKMHGITLAVEPRLASRGPINVSIVVPTQTIRLGLNAWYHP